MVKEAGSSSLELLIHWVDRPLEEASWENYDLIAEQFPSFRLEDKATFQGGCTDTNAPLRTYSRRKYRRAAWGDAILPNCPVCLFKFFHDQDWRIRHAAITAIGLISDGCSKALLVEMVKFGQSIVNLMQDSHPRLLPALIEVLDDFDYPRLQTRADSVIRLFSRNCRADDLKLYLHKIVSKLVRFQQRGLAMMKEEALETLASVAISSQVTAVLISLQETQTEIEDPMRKFSLLAYGRLCKCLGEDFLPYLSLAMPIVLKSAQLSVSNSSDTDDSDDESMIKVTAGNKKIGIRSALLEEKALACHILCCFAAELKGRLHLWVNEESKVHVQARLLEAFNESIQIPGSRLSKHQAEKFVEGISKVLLTCSYRKTEREKRSKEQTDSREQELLKEEAQQHIGICLGTMVKKLKASFLPLLDKFLPYVSLMWGIVMVSLALHVSFSLFCALLYRVMIEQQTKEEL
ncbi:hypothetical protein KY284_029464 [Solanum tuberosum]|nr:hypothetical protein KY284_029464 [Solanum tuberosum]